MVVLGLALCASAAAAPRPGKVVRVEHEHALLGSPRLCEITPETNQALCYGEKPIRGDKIAVVGETGVLGKLRIDEVDAIGLCGVGRWTVKVQVESGVAALGTVRVAYVIGLPDDASGARLVYVDRIPGDRPVGRDTVTAIDMNRDRRADFAFVSYMCDERGRPTQGTQSLSAASTECQELWRRTGRGFELLRSDRIPQCM
jgi:hypothetical protein